MLLQGWRGFSGGPRDFGFSLVTCHHRVAGMTTTARRVRVIRGVVPAPADLGTVRSQHARHLVVDPELIQGATDDGYRAGYQAGFDAGLADAADAISAREQRRATDIQSTLAQLQTETEGLHAAYNDVIIGIEEQVVAIAAEIAEIIVGRELVTSAEPGVDALRRALQFAPTGAAATVRMHPDDITTLDGSQDSFGRELAISADPSLQRGDCVVDIASLRIDARLDAAFDRIREVVGA